MRCLVRLVSRISSDASPVLRCTCRNQFLGFTVEEMRWSMEGWWEDRSGVSLWENYIGFALGSLGQGPLGPLCQRDEVYIKPTSIILWMRPVRHPFCALFSSAHALIWAFNILPARRYAPLVTHVATSSARDTSFGHLWQRSFWGFATIFDVTGTIHAQRGCYAQFPSSRRVSEVSWVNLFPSCSSAQRDVIVFLALAYMTAVHSGNAHPRASLSGARLRPPYRRILVKVRANTSYFAWCLTAQGSCPGYASFETLIDMPMDRALVSGVFSTPQLPLALCIWRDHDDRLGRRDEIGKRKFRERSFPLGHVGLSVRLVDRFGHQGTRSSKRCFMYTFPLSVHIAHGDFPSAPRERIMLPFPSSEGILEAAKVADVSAVFF
ncbi:hypothetical protein EDB84DRAFT_1442408 [Lactarius hengduanensis]|nr:hypothetical protein EDB84DRAFT_1442408 [Lactarius hengduanensis]